MILWAEMAERPIAVDVADLLSTPGFVWRWPHVDPVSEWADKQSGRIVIVPEFLDLFEELRRRHGRPIPITSGYRTPEHNAAVSTTGDRGPHTYGQAVDIRCGGRDAYALALIAFALGFTGIGFGQNLDLPLARRYLHLDTLTPAQGFPQRPNIWSY